MASPRLAAPASPMLFELRSRLRRLERCTQARRPHRADLVPAQVEDPQAGELLDGLTQACRIRFADAAPTSVESLQAGEEGMQPNIS